VRVGLIVTGGVDAAGRDVVPALLWLIERLARRHDVHVFVLHYYREPRTYPLLGATVHDIGRVEGPPGLRRARTAARLGGAISRVGGLDLLHAYLGIPGSFAAGIAARLGIPAIVTLDSGELVALPDIGYGLQRRWSDRRAVRNALCSAARVTVSTTYMARMPALEGTPVDIVPIGVDTNIFRISPAGEGPPWRLVRVASINPVKDYGTLLRAFAAAGSRIRDVHLDIVGVDTMNRSMQMLSDDLGVAPNVAFHGVQSTAALASLYARAHLHVVSSRHEAASVATLEAAACGVATVGTRVGYVADWAAADRAVAVAIGDASALASAIVDLLVDRERRRRVASAAHAWALAHDADFTAARFEAIYAEVASPRRR
jgi:glycosyltransferase involved in cell wall biosynthesis